MQNSFTPFSHLVRNGNMQSLLTILLSSQEPVYAQHSPIRSGSREHVHAKLLGIILSAAQYLYPGLAARDESGLSEWPS